MTDLGAPVLAWVEDAIGKDARIRSVTQMETWSVQMHALVVEVSGGAEYRLVLRRYTDERLGIDRFYDPANEARALRLLGDTDIPAPRLFGADLEPVVCDVPAVLESWVPGEPAWTPGDVDNYLRSAAETLVRIHAFASTRPDGLPDYVPYAIGDGVELRPRVGQPVPACGSACWRCWPARRRTNIPASFIGTITRATPWSWRTALLA